MAITTKGIAVTQHYPEGVPDSPAGFGLARSSTLAKPSLLNAFSNCEKLKLAPCFGRSRTCCLSKSMVTLVGSTHGRESSAFCARGFQEPGQCIPGTDTTYSSGEAEVVLRSGSDLQPTVSNPTRKIPVVQAPWRVVIGSPSKRMI